MNAPHSHPRRRYLNNAQSLNTTQSPLDATTSLRKSSTFHSPTSPSCSDEDPILNIPSLPRRSPTCPKDLESLVAAVERSLSGLESFVPESQQPAIDEALPVPRFVLDAHVNDRERMEIDRSSNDNPSHTGVYVTTRNHHTSDSGIGSSLSLSEPSMSGDHAGMKQGMMSASMERPVDSRMAVKAFAITTTTTPTTTPSTNDGHVHSGINGISLDASPSLTSTRHALSEYACRQIQKHIIVPIIREEKLKAFHPLVSGIPHRVARKEITCLRDLEKVLLWLAPKRSVSKASFINFCETSIQCIHTTVDYLNEHDQRRPADRPYTNGYFLDLVEQIRQYATMLADTRRARMAADPQRKESERSCDEKIVLVGGLSQTGQPAELVRVKDGHSISLRTGEEVTVEKDLLFHGTKRSASEESDDDDVLRSMARRRKNAPPIVKEIQRCSDCDKVFKRPCDLTKHEKTHSRPWKCSESGCKYYEYGWPTEKERDRHVNDKHSAAPSLYQCQYHPCPYESKRESNCKQHMEKAHGWVYVRSKNNGKTGNKPQPGRTPPTPQMSTPGSYIFNASTPEDSMFLESSSMPHHPESISGSVVNSDFSAPFGTEQGVAFTDTFGPFDPNFAWDESGDRFGLSTDYATGSNRPWDTTDLTNPLLEPSAFESSLMPHDQDAEASLFGESFDWANQDHDITSLNLQLSTPAMSVETRPLDCFSRNTSISLDLPLGAQNTSLSPGTSANVMLYSPHSLYSNDLSVDEGFGDFPQDMRKPTDDFRLFDDASTSSTTKTIMSTMPNTMFQDLSTFQMPSAWSGRGRDLAQQLDLGDDLMQIDE